MRCARGVRPGRRAHRDWACRLEAGAGRADEAWCVKDCATSVVFQFGDLGETMMTLSHGVQNINYRQYRLEVRYQGRGWKVFCLPAGSAGPVLCRALRKAGGRKAQRSIRLAGQQPRTLGSRHPLPTPKMWNSRTSQSHHRLAHPESKCKAAYSRKISVRPINRQTRSAGAVA